MRVQCDRGHRLCEIAAQLEEVARGRQPGAHEQALGGIHALVDERHQPARQRSIGCREPLGAAVHLPPQQNPPQPPPALRRTHAAREDLAHERLLPRGLENETPRQHATVGVESHGGVTREVHVTVLEVLLELLADRHVVRVIGRGDLLLAVENRVDVRLGGCAPGHVAVPGWQCDVRRGDALTQGQLIHR